MYYFPFKPIDLSLTKESMYVVFIAQNEGELKDKKKRLIQWILDKILITLELLLYLSP